MHSMSHMKTLDFFILIFVSSKLDYKFSIFHTLHEKVTHVVLPLIFQSIRQRGRPFVKVTEKQFTF